jgi:hypothetical protein
MKFEEWYLKNREVGNHVNMKEADIGWNACKEQILQIINKFDKEYCYQFLKDKIKEEI